MMNFRKVCMLSLCIFAGYLYGQEQEVATSAWELIVTADDSTPVARHEAAFVAIGNRFYLLGGRGIKPTNVYDVEKNIWTQAAAPPIEMHHFQPVVFQDKIYVIGAMTGKYPSETPIASVYIYDPKKDVWTQGAAIPKNRQRGATGTVVYDGHIYIACGIKNGHIGDHKKWLDRYDPKTDTWEVLADAPRARDHFQAAVVDGKIYAVAGRLSKAPEHTFNETIAEVDVYDIATDRWQTLLHPIPTQRAGNTAIAVADEIYVIGGESASQKTAHAEVEVLDTKTQDWRSLPSLLSGRHGTSVILHEKQLYIASGCGNRGGNPELTTMERCKID